MSGKQLEMLGSNNR